MLRACARAQLAAEGLPRGCEEASLGLQFSSLSSVGKDTKWLRELVSSLAPGEQMPRLRVVFPTRRQVGEALEG